jgi:hypothetical protein
MLKPNMAFTKSISNAIVEVSTKTKPTSVDLSGHAPRLGFFAPQNSNTQNPLNYPGSYRHPRLPPGDGGIVDIEGAGKLVKNRTNAVPNSKFKLRKYVLGECLKGKRLQ